MFYVHGKCPHGIPGCDLHLRPATEAELRAYPPVRKLRKAAREVLARFKAWSTDGTTVIMGDTFEALCESIEELQTVVRK